MFFLLTCCVCVCFADAKLIRGDYPSLNGSWGSAFDLVKLQEYVASVASFGKGEFAVAATCLGSLLLPLPTLVFIRPLPTAFISYQMLKAPVRRGITLTVPRVRWCPTRME